MNYLIQRGKVRSQVINVPEGLPELLSDITREVLRCQPTTECLCQFIIDYLHSVLVTREKARVAKSIIDRALRMVDEIIEDMCICDITKVKADKMAATMEECFRKFLEKRRCESRNEKEILKFHEVDMLDELIKRCKFTEYELKMTRPMIEEAYNRFVQAYLTAAEGTDGTEALYQYFRHRELQRLDDERLQLAATKIQSRFRGFLVRRSMFLDEKEPEVMITIVDPIEDEAARKIQKFYRQHRKASITDSGYERQIAEDELCEPASQTVLGPQKADAAAEALKQEAVPEQPVQPEPVPEATPPAEVSEEPTPTPEEEPAEAVPEPEPEPEVETAAPEPEPEPEPEPPAEEPAAAPEPPAAEAAAAAEEAPPNEEAPAEPAAE